MFKLNKFTVAIVAAIFFIVIIGVMRPGEIDWTPSFNPGDKIPYGTYILYHSLHDIFNTEPELNTQALFNRLEDEHFTNTSLIFIEKSFVPEDEAMQDILSFAADGNKVFISAGHIKRRLLDTLAVKEERTFYSLMGGVTTNTLQDSINYSQANFTNNRLRSDSSYHFKKDFFPTSYLLYSDTSQTTISDSTSQITVLGVDGSGHPDFICVAYGKGFIYLHSNPYAFTNYYMLNARGSDYVAKCLSYIAANRIIWNGYGIDTARKVETPLRFILSTEALRWAYYTALFFILLFIAFNIKRRQRIIPVIDPFKNTSLEFTKTIGALYFNQAGHKNIAHKKITYFLEFIRNRYGLDTSALDEEFARKLGHKSGVDNGGVQHLLNIISGVESKTRISDTELIDLNHAIEYFKNNCQ